MTTLLCGLLVLGLVATLAFALDFPPLTGRIVDQANIIGASSRADIETKLTDLEDKSGIQLVVATVKTLAGNDIETYANGLFRFWKLGEKDKNNGVLLLVAPNEHKVRIEVGYGLEATLTDALSSVIISSAIVPRFRANDYSGGVARGVDGIIGVLSGDSAEWQKKVELRRDDRSGEASNLTPFLIFLVILFIVWYLNRHSRGGMMFIPPIGSSFGSGFGGGSGGGFSGGGFFGGGGSSGGGGASGSW